MDQCIRGKIPYPDAIKNAPELDFTLALYYGAFFDLTTCRTVGMGEGPIPWTSINDYCSRLDLSVDQSDDMFYYIRIMDGVYLDHKAKKDK